MDMLLDVFKQLGADSSIFIQFGIILIGFYISKFLFVNHLHNILDTRDEKTSKLAGNTEKQFEDIKKSQEEYKLKISNANKKIKADIETKKNIIAKSEEQKYRSQEKELNEYIQNSKKEIQANIEDKKTKILSEAQELASSLVQKITKG